VCNEHLDFEGFWHTDILRRSALPRFGSILP
jgi:hypothetical protein